jgi:hypothetical protein
VGEELRRHFRRWLVACVLLFAGTAVADPGPLSNPHAHLDNPSSCDQCHVAFGGVPEDKCLACHRDIDQRLAQGRGFHGRAAKQPCNVCHREHLGRAHEIVPLDRRTFNHDATGWPLTGGHIGPGCRDCHTSKRPGSARDSYLGASPECKACHGEYHGRPVGRVKLDECDKCHNTVDWRKLNGNLKFDHNKETRFPKTGKHVEVPCEQCHTDPKTFAPLEVAGCVTCHRDPHPKGVFGRRLCEECHVTAGFEKTSVFEHGSTGWPLRGKHTQQACTECHTWNAWKPRTSDCVGCHKDSHRGQFAGTPCSKCHTETGFDDLGRFNHNTMSRFPLQGRHKRVDCASCHPGGRYKPIEPACETCHLESNPHGDTFKGAACASCHSPEGWMQTRFDHSVTGFPLLARHEDQPCHRCHPNGTETQDDTVQDCAFCHKDIHRNQFEGATCDRCHRGFEQWRIRPEFDHTLSRFALEGRHTEVQCVGCHKAGHFRPIDTACANCHQNFHEGQFSRACDECHTPVGWNRVERFDHAKQTQWPLFGKHTEVDCEKCHVENEYRLPTECGDCHVDAHAGRRGPDCAQCHSVEDWKGNAAQNHDFGPFRLEGAHDLMPCEACHGPGRRKELAATGPECVNCHRDPHFGSLGPFCYECHSQDAFLPAKFLHNETGFRLSGAHRFVECRECHPGRVFGGLPGTCDFCHTDTFQRTKRPDHEVCCPGGLTSCENCHTTRSFVPARAGVTCGDPRIPACVPR